MKNLRSLLLEKGYTEISLLLTKTRHLEVMALLNGVEGRFILDTGASNTCVGFACAADFNLTSEESDAKASGAGAVQMETKIARKNCMEMGAWKRERLSVILFDLSHVNWALEQHHAPPVHGIIGADILKRAQAVIDYKRGRLFLK